MNTPKLTFAGHLLALQNAYSLPSLFDDVLTLIICILSPGVLAGLPWNRTLFENTIAPYTGAGAPLPFMQLFASLLEEMQCRRNPYAFVDVLGDFYEEHIPGYDPLIGFSSLNLDEYILKHGTPLREETFVTFRARKVRLVDSTCGSGKRLFSAQRLGDFEGLYGIDSCPVRVKMAIINLFLSSVEQAEVACIQENGNGHAFHGGYRFSLATSGIMPIARAKDSVLWNMAHQPAACILA